MRTETQTRTVYTFDELSDNAKDRARDWWRNILTEDTDWSEHVINDAGDIADILGIDLRQRDVRLYGGGKTRYEPAIWWDLGRDGGVGFDASYSYAPGSAKKIREHAPQDNELHCIADTLQRVQRRHFYRLTASIRAAGCGGTLITVDVENSDSRVYASEIGGDTDEAVTEAMRDFAHWIHSALQREYDWRMASEQVDEDIRANEYEFTEEGERL